MSRVALILLGALAALILVEALARLLGPPFNPEENILGSLHQCERLVGWRGIPNLSTTIDTDGQYEHKVIWNSLGMHDGEHQTEKEQAVFRILMLGDSFVQASEVTEGQTSHQVLEDILNAQSSPNLKFEVVSGGVLGWGPNQELMYFRSEGRHYSPNLVLALWVPTNDLLNVLPNHVFTGSGVNCYAPYFVLCNAQQFDPEPWFAVPGIAPTWKNCSTSKKILTTFLNHVYFNSKLFQHLAPSLTKEHTFTYASPYTPWIDQAQQDEVLNYAYNVTANIYDQLATEAIEINAKTALVVVPFRQVIQYELDPSYRAGLLAQIPLLQHGSPTLPNQRFTELMTNRGLPVLDLYPHFVSYYKNGGESLHWTENFHWNITGNRIVAQLIAQWLIEENLVPLE